MTRFSRRFFTLDRGWSIFRIAGVASLAAGLILFATFPDASRIALAQGYDCNGLRAQIAALDQTNTRANPYAGQIRSQRAGLERLEAYGHKLGCDRQQFFFFGSSPPPQCGQVNAQI